MEIYSKYNCYQICKSITLIFFSDLNYANEKLDNELYSSSEIGEGRVGLKVQKKKLHAVINEFKTNLYTSLKNRFSHVFTKPNLMMATLLDPRYKEFGFTNESLLEIAVDYVKLEALKEAYDNETVENSASTVPKQPTKTVKVKTLEIF